MNIEAQRYIAVFLAADGAEIFVTGSLLSIYRERLLALPEKVKPREGVFRVLGWRSENEKPVQLFLRAVLCDNRATSPRDRLSSFFRSVVANDLAAGTAS
jgi:hypothetical protein